MSVSMKTVRLPSSGRTLRYELERKPVKNLNIRVRPDGSVHISAPARQPQADIEAQLIRREEWLLRAMERVTRRAGAHPDLPTLAQGDRLPYLGGSLRVRYAACAGRQGRWELDEPSGVLRVQIPDSASVPWRASALECFEKAKTQELTEGYLRRYPPLLAARGVGRPAEVRYRVMSSRYGSCVPATRKITFNTRLCEYPPAFVEYVVVHELCHLLHPDHSPAFWRAVETYLPDWRARRKLAGEEPQG